MFGSSEARWHTIRLRRIFSWQRQHCSELHHYAVEKCNKRFFVILSCIKAANFRKAPKGVITKDRYRKKLKQEISEEAVSLPGRQGFRSFEFRICSPKVSS